MQNYDLQSDYDHCSFIPERLVSEFSLVTSAIPWMNPNGVPSKISPSKLFCDLLGGLKKNAPQFLLIGGRRGVRGGGF